MVAHGAWLAASRKESAAAERSDMGAMGRTLDAMFHQRELEKASAGAQPPLVADVNLPGTQVFAARVKGGSTSGFYIAAQGGHNNESHNHNDVGNFIVFHDGEPVLIDVGVETYTSKTFSSRRYEIWTMQSAWHNCPTINGVMQAAGREYEARQFAATPGAVTMEIQHAYPREAGINRWTRAIALGRAANEVTIKDTFDLARRESIELSLITTRLPKAAGPGVVTLDGGFAITFDKALTAVIDEHSPEDARLLPNWGPVVRRIRLSTKTPPAQGSYTVSIRKT
jgi:hypothetical protein